jgi:hypothetical protein
MQCLQAAASRAFVSAVLFDFVVREKQLADPAVGKATDGADVVQAADCQLKCLGVAPVGEAFARGHGAPSFAWVSR